MKHLIVVFLSLAALITFGCSTVSKQIEMKSHTTRTDVFTEVETAPAPAPPGFADLTIKASIKTHGGEHPLWWIKDSHGTSGYPIIVNVEGQAESWAIDPKDHVVPKTGSDHANNPETGSGVVYVVEKRLRAKAGEQNIFFGLPDDGCCRSVKVSLQEGRENVLEFKPVYNKPGDGTVRNFMLGIERLEAFFNGERVQ